MAPFNIIILLSMTEIEIPGFKATTGTLDENVWHLFKWNVQHKEWFRFGYYYPRNDAFSGSFHGDDMKSMQDLRERVKRNIKARNDERSVATVAP